MTTPEFLRSPDSSFADLADYPFAPNYFDIDGLRMHYIDEGPRDALRAARVLWLGRPGRVLGLFLGHAHGLHHGAEQRVADRRLPRAAG